MARKTYNGYPSWGYWNVSLWIGNDEGLYRTALDCIRYARNSRNKAAEMMRDQLNECGIFQTPDGANYSKSAILHAMRGL